MASDSTRWDPADPPSPPSSDEKFEEALGKLEGIVRRLETGEMTLDESLRAFEVGVHLSGLCHRRLDEAERKVEMLLADGTRARVDALEAGLPAGDAALLRSLSGEGSAQTPPGAPSRRESQDLPSVRDDPP